MNQPFDDTVKQFYRRLFLSWGISEVESEKEVFSRSRKIDLVVKCSPADLERLQDTVFCNFDELNGIELKGDDDPITLHDYNIMMMRIWGLGAMDWSIDEQSDTSAANNEKAKASAPDNSKLLPDEYFTLPSRRTLTIISVKKPVKLLQWFKDEFKFQPTEEPGIYFCNDRLRQWIICPRELRLVPKNYPLLPLAKGKKLADFIDVCLREGLTVYLQLVIDVGVGTDPDVIWQKMSEAKQMKSKIREETWVYIDRFFQDMPEAFYKIPTFRNAFVEQEKQVAQQAKQQTFIRQLRRKFAFVPDDVVSQIERTTDSQELESWLDQILSANSLQEMGFATEMVGHNGISVNGDNGAVG